jgi:hypothetical protein
MKSILTIAAAALLGAASFANAETVLNGNQMDQVTAGAFGWAYSVGGSSTIGDLLSDTYAEAGTLVDLQRPAPIAASYHLSTGIAQTALQGGIAASASLSSSGAQLGN